MLEVKVNMGHAQVFPCCRNCGGAQDERVAWTKSKLSSEGYDSIIYDPGDGPEYIVFDPKQIVGIKELPFDPSWLSHPMSRR